MMSKKRPKWNLHKESRLSIPVRFIPKENEWSRTPHDDEYTETCVPHHPIGLSPQTTHTAPSLVIVKDELCSKKN